MKTKLKELCAEVEEELKKKPLAKAVAAAWAVTLLATLPAGDARRAICTETRIRGCVDTIRRDKGWLRRPAAPGGGAAVDAAAAEGRGGKRKRAKFVEPEGAEAAKARRAEGEAEKAAAASAAAAEAAAVAADWLALQARSSAYADGSQLVVAATRSDAADVFSQLLALRLRAGGLYDSTDSLLTAVAAEMRCGQMASKAPAEPWAALWRTSLLVALHAPARAAPREVAAPPGRIGGDGRRLKSTEAPAKRRSAQRSSSNWVERGSTALRTAVFKASALGAGCLQLAVAAAAATRYGFSSALLPATAEVGGDVAALDAATAAPSSLAGGCGLLFYMSPAGDTTHTAINFPAASNEAFKAMLAGLAGRPVLVDRAAAARAARTPATAAEADAAADAADAMGRGGVVSEGGVGGALDAFSSDELRTELERRERHTVE